MGKQYPLNMLGLRSATAITYAKRRHKLIQPVFLKEVLLRSQKRSEVS